MEKKRWPGYTDEAHPELFNTAPPQPKELKPGQIDADKINQFFKDGFIILESFFDPAELDPCKAAVNEEVELLAKKLYVAGKIKDMYSECGYENRLTMIDNEFPGACVLLHKMGSLPQAFRDVWSNERLMNVAEQILGTADISGHPVWNLRTKTPKNEETTVPWHQDVAYLDNRSYNVFQLTAWIPLMNATEETGCMQMVRYGHKTGRIATHTCCAGNTWYVELSEDEMRNTLECDLDNDIVTVPVNYGSVLLLNNMIPHRSLSNRSNEVRWSLDLRWQRADKNPGFYDIKPAVQMRSSSDENFTIDWDSFINMSRHDTHQQQEDAEAKKKDEFDTTIAGPWMLKWEMTHTNRHTDALKNGDITSWHSALQ
jgi:ectoine hydroxylase-related dioxygenase (phytanoyl-CoA dioxygenase family)